jgi:hypothetical protein
MAERLYPVEIIADLAAPACQHPMANAKFDT